LKSISFVQDMFRDFYKNFSLTNEILMIEKREFGFASFDGWMLRHKHFKDKNGLENFLRESIPKDVYYSCAYYEDPEAEMEKKGWIGSDLTFDIDADHIPTSCDKIHDKWTCSNCGFIGKGVTPEKCPACNSEKFMESTWPCEECISSAKIETIKLLDMLLLDFGFSEREVHVFFSGHRGYHIHVESESVRTLDSVARKEIVDYVCGLGLDLPLDIFTAGNLEASLEGFGWRKRIVSGMKRFILSADEQNLVNAGIRRKEAKNLLMNKEILQKNWIDTQVLRGIKGIGFETWKKIAEQSVKMQSAKVDTVVTTDIHRLIRLADTLHGKTGLKKVQFPISAIEAFDPFKNAVAFKKGSLIVFVSEAPQFRLGDEIFGPYRNRKVELPTAAAMLLVCKGRAEVVE